MVSSAHVPESLETVDEWKAFSQSELDAWMDRKAEWDRKEGKYKARINELEQQVHRLKNSKL